MSNGLKPRKTEGTGGSPKPGFIPSNSEHQLVFLSDLGRGP